MRGTVSPDIVIITVQKTSKAMIEIFEIRQVLLIIVVFALSIIATPARAQQADLDSWWRTLQTLFAAIRASLDRDEAITWRAFAESAGYRRACCAFLRKPTGRPTLTALL